MKLRTFILTGIALLLLSATTKAEVNIKFEENDLIASSNLKGTEGFKGCTATKLEKIPAYTFRLLKKETPSNNAACRISSGKWREVDEQTSDNGAVIFEDLPDGEYKVLCLVGKAIGCLIDEVPEGYPNRSIVYEQEWSKSTNPRAKDKTNESTLTAVETGFLIFPNPAEDEVNIQLNLNQSKLKGQAVLNIYDMQGKQLYTQVYTVNQNERAVWQISTSNYSSGTYLIRMVDGNGVSVEGKFQIVQSE